MLLALPSSLFQTTRGRGDDRQSRIVDHLPVLNDISSTTARGTYGNWHRAPRGLCVHFFLLYPISKDGGRQLREHGPTCIPFPIGIYGTR